MMSPLQKSWHRHRLHLFKAIQFHSIQRDGEVVCGAWGWRWGWPRSLWGQGGHLWVGDETSLVCNQWGMEEKCQTYTDT